MGKQAQSGHMTCSKSLRVKAVIFASGQTMSRGGGGSHAETSPPSPMSGPCKETVMQLLGYPTWDCQMKSRVLLH